MADSVQFGKEFLLQDEVFRNCFNDKLRVLQLIELNHRTHEC